MAVEDKRFYSDFHGIDLSGIARAALADLKAGSTVQGASTITEQYVKNAYLGGYDGTLTLQAARGDPGLGADGPLVEGPHPDGLPEHRLLRRRGLRGGGGRRDLLPQERLATHAGAGALLAGLPQDPSGYSPVYDPARPWRGATWCCMTWPARATSPRPKSGAP